MQRCQTKQCPIAGPQSSPLARFGVLPRSVPVWRPKALRAATSMEGIESHCGVGEGRAERSPEAATLGPATNRGERMARDSGSKPDVSRFDSGHLCHFASEAQVDERPFRTREDAGSKPVRGSNPQEHLFKVVS